MPPRKRQPVQLPADNIVKDSAKHSWRIGKQIGVGGFGEVFLCSKGDERPVGDKASFVIKIEPSQSGPLFVEMHFYMRNAVKEVVDKWISSKQLDYLGIPIMHSKGQYEVNNQVYRFIIIDRYSEDLEVLLKTHKGKLPPKTALTTGIRVLDVLEYIHNNDYVHADVKASNIMLGLRDRNKVYICDFGLACKYAKDGSHKEEKEDKKKMHNGTIEYTSRDAHKGKESRRADVEILAYNLLHWLSGKLPWLDLIKDCKAVAAAKEKQMTDVKNLVKACFGSKGNKTMVEFLSAVAKLKFDEKPNYEQLRSILKNGLKDAGLKYDGNILAEKSDSKKRKSDTDLSSEALFSSDEEIEETKKPTAKPKKEIKPKKKYKITGGEVQKPSSSTQENLTPAMMQVLESRKKKNEAGIRTRSTRTKQNVKND